MRYECYRCGKNNGNLLFNHNFSSLNTNNFTPINQNIFPNMPNYDNGNIQFNNNQNQRNNDYYSNSLELNNSTNFQNNNIYNKFKKPFIEKAGDWICFNCHNLNFAFRTNCNICHMTKKNNNILIKKNWQLLGLNF